MRATLYCWRMAEQAPEPSQTGADGDRKGRRLRVRLAMIVPAVAAVLTFLVGTAWVASQPSVYTGKATVIFSAKVGASGTIPGSDTVVLTANNALGVVSAPVTVARVAADSGISTGAVSSGTVAKVPTGTATLEIDVTAQSPDSAAKAANSYAQLILEDMKPNQLVAAQQVGKALPADSPSGPPRTILTAVVAALAALVGLLVLSLFVWLERLRGKGGVRGLLRGWMRPREDAADESEAA